MWRSVEFDEERLATLQMRLGSVDIQSENTDGSTSLSREEQLERHYWGFQKLLNLLPPNNALSIGPQLNNDLEVHEEMQRAVRVRLECLERVITLLRDLKSNSLNVLDTLKSLAEERERLRGWNALVYLAKIDLEASPALDDLSVEYLRKLNEYNTTLQVADKLVETKVRLDTDLKIIETVQLLLKYNH